MCSKTRKKNTNDAKMNKLSGHAERQGTLAFTPEPRKRRKYWRQPDAYEKTHVRKHRFQDSSL
jgi:hypothetical protein